MILRTYGCADCGHTMTVELRSEQWDAPPPECPACAERVMHQHFVPPAIGGSNRARATALALDIAERDYGVADIQADGKEGERPKVRFKEQSSTPSSWGTHHASLEQAIALGRQNRLQYGSGLDALQSALKSGAQPDLIAQSRRNSIKVW